jgi:hypothetical protein
VILNDDPADVALVEQLLDFLDEIDSLDLELFVDSA